MNDRQILRELAARYRALANSDRNYQNMLCHRAVNDLKASRPVVLIEELPWEEMNIDGALTLHCQTLEARKMEQFFRRALFRDRYFPADGIYRPYYAVQKQIHTTGIGLVRQENEHQQGAKSHTYVDQIPTEADIDRLHFETISYDAEATWKRFEFAADMIGDILPVKLVGEATGYSLGLKTMDDIVNLRGLDNFFYDFIEEPEFMHKLIRKLTDIFMDKIRQYEALDLLDGDAYECHCTAALSNDLEPSGGAVKAKNVWGRGLAQIFASVSPAMHAEFDIAYMKEALAPFGLVYYGCCEPLDKKIDILREIPNLRKISITPWADVDVACEAIGRDYVVASKPNPSKLALGRIDEDAIRGELQKIVAALQRNNCCADIVLKDISTVGGKPESLIRWHDIAMKVVRDAYGD